MKTFTLSIVLVSVLILAGIWWQDARSQGDPNVISRNGLHWHPTLEMYVKGVKQEIPENIGLGAIHQPVHTHDDLPKIHLELSGTVRREDILLGEFFKSWQRDIRSFGSNMKMTVNGEENTEYENYMMRDGDRIELRYE